MLRPVGYYRHPKKGIMIEYVCDKCGVRKVNKFLEHDAAEADDLNILLAIAKDS